MSARSTQRAGPGPAHGSPTVAYSRSAAVWRTPHAEAHSAGACQQLQSTAAGIVDPTHATCQASRQSNAPTHASTERHPQQQAPRAQPPSNGSKHQRSGAQTRPQQRGTRRPQPAPKQDKRTKHNWQQRTTGKRGCGKAWAYYGVPQFPKKQHVQLPQPQCLEIYSPGSGTGCRTDSSTCTARPWRVHSTPPSPHRSSNASTDSGGRSGSQESHTTPKSARGVRARVASSSMRRRR